MLNQMMITFFSVVFIWWGRLWQKRNVDLVVVVVWWKGKQWWWYAGRNCGVVVVYVVIKAKHFNIPLYNTEMR